MLKVELRPSLRLVQHIGRIERFAGMWDRIGQSEAIANEAVFRAALERGAECAFLLDSTSPPESLALRSSIEVERAGSAAFISRSSPRERFVRAHLHEVPLDLEGIQELYRLAILGDDSAAGEEGEGTKLLRTQPLYFTAPSSRPHVDERVFPGVSSFIVPNRLSELLEWTETELTRDGYHPLLVVGVFHLLFLQTLPFPTGNHRLALLLDWQLLKNSGFSFVRFTHPATALQSRSRQYFAALRQAEQTAGTSWSTVNSWLELFLEALLECASELRMSTERNITEAALTSVQRRIIDVVRANGSVSRERIINETGINVSTVKYNLSVLAMKGHLKREGGGRTTSYRLL